MLRNKERENAYVTAHYEVIYSLHHRRKRHFEEIVDSYKIIIDV